jgi:hypothetical protein
MRLDVAAALGGGAGVSAGRRGTTVRQPIASDRALSIDAVVMTLVPATGAPRDDQPIRTDQDTLLHLALWLADVALEVRLVDPLPQGSSLPGRGEPPRPAQPAGPRKGGSTS